MREVEEVLAEQFFARVTDDVTACLIDAKELAIGVEMCDADGCVLECATETLCTFPQCCFVPFQVGDVSGGPDETNGFSVRIAHDRPTYEMPTDRPVLCSHTSLVVVILPIA